MSFFTFWCQLFHLFFGRLGIPIFGNKSIPCRLWRSHNNHFCSQAENDLPPHGWCIAGTEPVQLIKVRTWRCTMVLSSSFCFTYIFFLLASSEIIYFLPPHSYQMYFFITILITALLFPYFPHTLPFFHPLCLKRSSVIQAVLWRLL